MACFVCVVGRPDAAEVKSLDGLVALQPRNRNTSRFVCFQESNVDEEGSVISNKMLWDDG